MRSEPGEQRRRRGQEPSTAGGSEVDRDVKLDGQLVYTEPVTPRQSAKPAPESLVVERPGTTGSGVSRMLVGGLFQVIQGDPLAVVVDRLFGGLGQEPGDLSQPPALAAIRN